MISIKIKKIMRNKKAIGISLLLLGLIVTACQPSSSTAKQANNQIHLLSDTLRKSSCVYLTENRNEIPVVSWVEIDTATLKKSFFFAKWDRKQQQFGARHAIPIPKNTSIHEEGMPKIAYKGDGTMLVFFETSTPAVGQMWGIGDILTSQSKDKGKTWSKPTSIYPQKPKNYSISFSGITPLNNGEVGITCLGTNQDSTEVGRPVLFIQTKGDALVSPVTVTQNACECCRTALSTDKNGRISIAFRDLNSKEVRDISYSTSIDGGMLFHHNRDFSKDNWVLDGCPHNGPSIKTSNSKNYVVWSTGGKNAGVNFAKLTSSGKMIDRKHISKDGQFIQLCLLPDNTAITAYNENYMADSNYFSRIVVDRINDTTFTQKIITNNKSSSEYPVVRPLNNKSVVVAWRDDNYTIHYKKVDINKITTPAKEASTPEERLAKKDKKKGEMVTDLVCGMNLKKDNVSDSLYYKGKEYRFCSPHCKQAFQNNPAGYMPME